MLNAIGRQQEQVVNTVNGIIKKQKKIAAEVQCLGRIIESSHDVQIIMRYMMVLDVIKEHLVSYEGAIPQGECVRMACESQVVNEKSIPLPMVREIPVAGGNIARVVPTMPT